jgi:hypothetical protein
LQNKLQVNSEIAANRESSENNPPHAELIIQLTLNIRRQVCQAFSILPAPRRMVQKDVENFSDEFCIALNYSFQTFWTDLKNSTPAPKIIH